MGNKWKTSTLRYVYNAKDDRGRGRLCMLISGIMSGLVGQLSSGLFYTGFLLGHGIDIVDIAIITFIPYITCFLNIFSPWLLEHFKKRKLILAAGKLLYYFINIVGITLLPELIEDPEARLAGFIAIVVVSNSINALFSSGYSAWQANFLPDDVRMDYFTSSGCINSLLSYIIVFCVSIITDRLEGSPDQLIMITMLRWIAFGLAVVDCLIQLIPKEYPYLKKAKTKLANIFVLPVKNKRFLLTILIAAAYTFATNLPNATLNAYVLEVLDGTGMQYTLPNAINALYFLFFIFFSKIWKKFVAKHYWFRAFAFAMLMQAVTYYMYVFVTADTVWLYVVVRLLQHIFGVVMNSIVASLPLCQPAGRGPHQLHVFPYHRFQHGRIPQHDARNDVYLLYGAWLRHMEYPRLRFHQHADPAFRVCRRSMPCRRHDASAFQKGHAAGGHGTSFKITANFCYFFKKTLANL